MEAKDFIVRGCRRLNANHYWLELNGAFANRPLPGQFVHIKVEPFFLRRPFSIAGCTDKRLSILFQVTGKGTESLALKKRGDHVSVVGPLGTPFPVDARDSNIWFAGGGTGIAPLLFLSSELKNRPIQKRQTFFYGARNKSLIFFGLLLPHREYVFATEDGSYGFKGRLNTVLSEHLDRLPAPDVIYGGGPHPLLREIARLAIEKNIPAFVSLENRMACGTGLCYGCVTKIKKAGGWEYKRVCKDGPVFEVREIEWE